MERKQLLRDGRIGELDIDDRIKKAYRTGRSAGLSRPVSMVITAKRQLRDLFTVIRYKLAQK